MDIPLLGRRSLATDHHRIKKLLATQPQVDHEVLWVIKDGLSESILLARSLLSSREEDIKVLLSEVVEALSN